MMKYDELLEILRECNDCRCEEHCPYHEERNNPLKCMTKIVGDAANAIEELTMKLHGDEAAIAGMKQQIERMVVNSGNKPKWIPVTERLPKAEYGESEDVLAIDSLKVMRVAYFDGGNWCFPTGEPIATVPKFPITHWMPLPESPKEETDG